MTKQQEFMAAVFNEWAKRYSENPDDFSDILDENGKPVEDYGECCALYYTQLEQELTDGFVEAHL